MSHKCTLVRFPSFVSYPHRLTLPQAYTHHCLSSSAFHQGLNTSANVWLGLTLHLSVAHTGHVFTCYTAAHCFLVLIKVLHFPQVYTSNSAFHQELITSVYSYDCLDWLNNWSPITKCCTCTRSCFYMLYNCTLAPLFWSLVSYPHLYLYPQAYTIEFSFSSRFNY